MTRSQVIIINILFGLFTSYGINAMFGFSSIATEMATLAIEASPQRTVKGNEYAPIFTLCALIPIVLACFKFMWDIRHRMCQLRSKHWIDHLADPRNCKGPPSPNSGHFGYTDSEDRFLLKLRVINSQNPVFQET